MLTRLWQLFREIFICFPYHRYGNVVKLKDFYTTEEHVRLQRGGITRLIPAVCFIRCDFQCTNSQFKLEMWSKIKAKIKIHIRNLSTSNKTCFHFHQRGFYLRICTWTQTLGSTSSIWLSRGCSNIEKAVPIIDPVFLPGSVLFQASSWWILKEFPPVSIHLWQAIF